MKKYTMTILELAERDYKKAKINYLRGKERKNIDPDELKHLEELMCLRERLLKAVKADLMNRRVCDEILHE